MITRPSTHFLPRLSRVRGELHAAALDAFVVTQAANIRYLTGFSGSAGLVVITQNRCDLVVDFRYGIAARAAIASSRDLESAVKVVIPPESYDDALVALLRESEAFRIGIEAAYMPVSRFNRLSMALANGVPTQHSTPDPCPVLVPTERLVERGRLIKDADEIGTMKEAGRRIAEAALEVPALVREGRSELEIASDIEAILRRVGFERTAFETIVASGPNSARPHAQARCARGDSRRRGGAGLWRRLRRILRRFDPDRPDRSEPPRIPPSSGGRGRSADGGDCGGAARGSGERGGSCGA